MKLVQNNNLQVINVYEDRACMFRVISVCVSGNDDNHIHIRANTV